MAIKSLMLVASLLGLTAVAVADAPFATAAFEKEVPNSDERVPITSATFNDFVCFVVTDVSTPDGDHSYRLVIYDGAGNEVHQSVNRVTATDHKWRYATCVTYKKNRDKPGTWWYVAELDDQPLVSKELVVIADG